MPGTIDAALVRKITSLVGHALALLDVKSEIEVAQSPFFAELELLQDRVGSKAVAAVSWIVAGIDCAQGRAASIDDTDADKHLLRIERELERVTTSCDQEVSIAFRVDGRLAISKITPVLVEIIDVYPALIDPRWTDSYFDVLFTSASNPFFTLSDLIVGNWDADRLTGDAARATWAIQDEALSAVPSK